MHNPFTHMSRRVTFWASLVLLLSLLPSMATAQTLTSLVDPLIGTDGGGDTYPGAVGPFGMVQFSPDTNAPSIGYGYGDKQIQGFSLTHMSGVGCDDFGDVFLTATTGAVKTNQDDYTSPFSHDHESASPGYYRVHLDKPDVTVELTAAPRAGAARFTFPAGQAANILLPLSHTLTESSASRITVVNDHEIEGLVTSQDFCGAPSTYTVYFVMQLDQPFASYGTWTDDTLTPGSHTAAQSDKKTKIGAYVTYPANAPRTVEARIGISFVDIAGARNNLKREIGGASFDKIQKQAQMSWEKELHRIEVQGGTPSQRKIFYTALYHCLLMPNVANDEDGRYLGYDQKIQKVAKGHALYANYSGWDIYRNEFPLLTLLEPQRVQDMCQSVALMYHQGGWIDRWPQDNTYTNVMCGSPLTTCIATAWNAGLHGFDMTTAYEGMWKDATQSPPPGNPYYGEDGVKYIDQIGYIPDDKVGYGAVSQTQEDCIAYAALASISDAIGKTSDAAYMRKRALDYRNVFDPETKFFRPRMADGSWLTPFDPTSDQHYVEGSAWHYRWLVTQDVKGMITLFGGDEAFNTEMDKFFSYPQPTWDGKYYNPYNETDLEAPFLYDYSGAPSKTQSRVRELLADAYKTTPGGIPGNDDCGTMSAWYIFAAMGFYPTDTSRPTFELCSPLFPKVTIHLDKPYAGRTFTVVAPEASDANSYIQSVQVNGQVLNQPWFSERVLTSGGALTFALGPTANAQWGQASRPPSLTP